MSIISPFKLFDMEDLFRVQSGILSVCFLFPQLLNKSVNVDAPCDGVYPPLHQALRMDPPNLEAAKLAVMRAKDIFAGSSLIAGVTNCVIGSVTPLYWCVATHVALT